MSEIERELALDIAHKLLQVPFRRGIHIKTKALESVGSNDEPTPSLSTPAILILNLAFSLTVSKTLVVILEAEKTQNEQARRIRAVYPGISGHRRHLSGHAQGQE
jgi:hypothetical protein